ncbi:hypothetical protein Y1Q_0003727 [Alligator mississippiensis]|uniref:Uncharacterized protein n=1 Tax=Alligator mississippiensis TaxID=8496 RepID=A0A151MN42_ALLMI|nr:hypothetical protein Y1Q_0003727 [Alligator mississippiensis]
MYISSTETAQELASQDEKLCLMESSLKATQEKLSEQIAETVRQEQNSRKSQTELKTLREHIIASEEEINDYKEMLEKLYFESIASKPEQQQHLQDLKQQLHKFEECGDCLQEKLNQKLCQQQNQQK